MKVVIVGGVAGGASTAARLRRLDESAEIIIFERTGYMSYANCGLPYYIGGVIKDKEKLTLQTPESFYARFAIEVRVNSDVLKIDRANKCVHVRNLETGEEYTESYDKLVLSPGAKPIKPSLDGIDSDKIFSLRTVEDTMRIKEYIDTHKPASVVVAGGGFIGLEMAENLSDLGIDTTVVEMADQVLLQLDYDMAVRAHAVFRSHNVKLRLKSAVAGFENTENGIRTLIRDGESIESDFVIMGLGVVPDSSLAKDAGLELGMKGSIVVNEHMLTNDEDIYALGDAVEVVNSVTGQKAVISLAGPANRQGRIVADNICGIKSAYHGSQGSSVVKLFEMTAASTGVNERTAKAAGMEYDKIVIGPASHATYYPGAHTQTIKVLFCPRTGKILGAQVTGYELVDKTIDVFATAIKAGMTYSDLAELDLSYAPPYSSAKSPANMAGFVIENIMTGKVKQVHWHDVIDMPRDGKVTLLDVRDDDEFVNGCIPGAINITVDGLLRGRMNELDKSKPIYVNCQTALRSYVACRILTQNGFDCYNFSGGYNFWKPIAEDCEADMACTHSCGKQVK